MAIWEEALTESDLNDKKARINRKVSIKLYESIGVAKLTLGDPAAAVDYLEKMKRYSTVTMTRSSGTGSQDLLDRARERKRRARRNPGLPEDPAALNALIDRVESYRGRIPIHVLPHELDALRAEHVARGSEEIIDHFRAKREEQEAAIAAGENPYERMVGRTATQGFYLFLMPHSGRLDEFPDRVCELTHLNQLRAPNHGFDSVPEEIGLLEALKFLDLSGNNIARLPDSIGKLRNLKTLKLKGNPLEEGEVQRLRALLPGCKIKG